MAQGHILIRYTHSATQRPCHFVGSFGCYAPSPPSAPRPDYITLEREKFGFISDRFHIDV
ncbi:MAG: hypothetical protein ACXADU_18790 [Promethearchaeota archaeon]